LASRTKRERRLTSKLVFHINHKNHGLLKCPPTF
jgi:hypothetical protein